jgi:UDP-N-acetylglucosamine 2-epimerase (non-hydrolysing)
VITDSGGIQEETTFLNVPCLTVRENTERPATIELGTNQRVGRDVNLRRRGIEDRRRTAEGGETHCSLGWEGGRADRRLSL